MVEVGNTRDELMRLVQLLAVEGTKIAETFARLHGLHHTDADALSRVLVAQDRGTPMTAGALATELGLTSGAITFVVDRLERAGHIHRVRDDSDRRKVFLRYTPGGRALADGFLGPAEKHSNAVMDQYTPVELEIVRNFLSATCTAMTAFRQSLTPPTEISPAPGGRPDRSAGT